MANESWAKVVLDSVGPNGKRLISVECRYWRMIHAEIMTHRDRARNAASSRAIPFIRHEKCDMCGGSTTINNQTNDWDEALCPACNGTGKGKPVENCTYSRIKDDAFFPEFMGAEQKGMQSGGELQEPNRGNCLASIERMRDFCLKECEYLYKQGLHKSIINRYLEPWSYITVIMTATEWKNFFRLRIHPKAEKHFNKVAGQIKDAIDASTPTPLAAGEWHMPYLRVEDREDLLEWSIRQYEEVIKQRHPEEISWTVAALKRISAARCARLSYLTHDGKRDLTADFRIFDTLIHPKIEEDRDDDVIHSSPLEHVAQACHDGHIRSGPFVGWKQFRKEFPNENVNG